MIFFNPKVSVLLTSYNNEMVESAIKSVLKQTYKNFELIILDDNSKPEILEIYERYKDPRIRFYNSHISEKNRKKECPYARQINVGLKMATGRLIVYMCDDVVYESHKLETMVNFLRRHPTVKVCYNRQKQRVFRGEYSNVLAPDRVLKNAFCRVDHNSVMHYKSCIDEVGNWDTNPPSHALADAFFWKKLNKKYLFYPIKEVLETHYSHDKSFSHKFAKKEYEEKK